MQTDRYTWRQTERRADRQIDREINREKDRHTNRATYSRTDRQLVVRARPRQIDIKQVVIRYLIDAWLVNLQLRRLTESSPSAGPDQESEPLPSICCPLYISDPQTARPGRFQLKKTQGASLASPVELRYKRNAKSENIAHTHSTTTDGWGGLEKRGRGPLHITQLADRLTFASLRVHCANLRNEDGPVFICFLAHLF